MFWCVVSLYIFTRCLYFDLPYGLVKIRHNSLKYIAILHTKTSNKIYLLYRHECFTGKYTARKIHTKPHLGLEWRIFHILTSKDIDDLPRKSSAIFGNFEKIFGNVRVTFGQVLKILRKSSESGRKSSERGKWSEIFGISSKRLSLINAVVKLIASRSDRLAEIYFCSK